MSNITVFQCDGPSCCETVDCTESDLADEGWFVVRFAETDGLDVNSCESHLCSTECLVEWASENTAQDLNPTESENG